MNISFNNFDCFDFLADDKVNLFIHVSYEIRCVSLFSKRNIEKLEVSMVFLFFSTDSMENTCYRENHQKIIDQCDRLWQVKPIEIPSERDFPLKSIELLNSKFPANFGANGSSVLIDVSTFTRDRLACLVHYFWRIRSKVPSVWFLHTAPNAYDSERDSGWLTKGVRRIAPVAGFNGRQAVHKKPLLVMILGHESERALISLRNREPNAVVLIQQGGTQISAGVRSAACRHAISIRESMTAPIIDSYEADYNDASGVRAALILITERYSVEYNIAVLIGGSKFQLIGLILACIENPNLEMIYSFPQKYNMDGFSSGFGRSEVGLLKFE